MGEYKGLGWATSAAVLWTLGTVALIAFIAVAWTAFISPVLLDTDANNRRASYERQETTRSLVVSKITEYEKSENEPHKLALQNEICVKFGEIRNLDDLPSSVLLFTEKNC